MSICDILLEKGDYFMHLADLKSYGETRERVGRLYADGEGWAKEAVINVASSEKFSSDRTIAEYAAEIWNAKLCPLERAKVAEARLNIRFTLEALRGTL